ncbi:alpha-taxilin-like [Watersipora subatra]|uniref:alpha-taxilin-like n=1 Tax=Watersipora subatra TaxID=2589382 RepID=UPI00355C8631
MDSLSMSDGGLSDQYHDCRSQPSSPRPHTEEECQAQNASREATPALSESSKENSPRPDSILESLKESSPRPDSGLDAAKKEAQCAADKKSKKREDKNMEYVLKALSSLSTPEEKLAALCKKYTDLLDDNRQHAATAKSCSKKLSQVSRERDSLQTENSKLILARSKLESLCRELQKHNKIIKDESMARQREEEERRKEVSGRFQTTIGDIQSQMESHSKRNDKLQEDNKELSGKLGSLLEQYEKREEHIQKLLHQKELETQLLEAKLGQCQLMVEKEQEKGGAEKQMLLEKLIESKTAQETMAQTEVHLKTQLQIYTQKYTEFETTLNKSNEVFAAFKSEMEKMSKKIKKLEKESLMYKQRWENANRALLEMVEQKTAQDKLIDTQTKRNKQLESLCRAMQQRKAEESDTPAVATVNGTQETDNQTVGKTSSTSNCSEVQADKKVLGPSNSVRPQAIGQSSDEQETGSENDKTDSSIADADSVVDEPEGDSVSSQPQINENVADDQLTTNQMANESQKSNLVEGHAIDSS